MVKKNPSVIAREALKLLFTRQLAPTPENYQAVYSEVASIAVPIPSSLARQIVRLLEFGQPAFAGRDERLREMAEQLVHFLRLPNPDLSTAELLLQNFNHRLSFAAQDEAQLRDTLLRLLGLIIQNIAALCLDDQWLEGQLDALQTATEPPLTLPHLQDIELRLKDVIFKQTEAKERLVQAQTQVRDLLATFIDRLADIGDTNTSYHDQLERCATRLSQVSHLHEITPLLEEVMTATRAMSERCSTARCELQTLREQSEQGLAEVERLRHELVHTSVLARQDSQTGVLNRRGMDEALEQEVIRTQAAGVPMCIALLDLDNFKALNDRLGHEAGDRALQHLVAVAKQIMRSQDQLARYGGEEFVFLLPGTQVQQAEEVMKRLQRKLTTRYFLQDSERVLITFSAGVAEIAPNENYQQALVRADRAMYAAKRAGKNRVVAASMDD
ncbi:MAG: GGDEF domain-containing protein [Comamonas sp.]|nr:GGDEF domain-containing protein [Comamonas sp.]